VPDYVIGLDLGQTTDYSAMIAVRRSLWLDDSGLPRRAPNDHRLLYRFRVGHIQRWPLRTAYTKIVEQVSTFVKAPQLGERPVLAIDATGVGRGIVDLFIQNRPEAELLAITVTAGHELKWERYASRVKGAHVPKLSLVSAVNAALGVGQLTIDKHLPDSQALVQELLNFKIKRRPSGNEAFEAERSGDHDDLVMALCMAVWAGSQKRVWFRGVPDDADRPGPLPEDPEDRAMVLEYRAEVAAEAAALQAERDAQEEQWELEQLLADDDD
jgi:hypothetical protein